MTKSELLDVLDRLLQDSKAAVFATVNTQNNPSVRWVTPGMLKRRPGYLYIVTASNANKVKHIQHHDTCELLLQSADFQIVVALQGKAQVTNDLGLTSDVLECLGKRLYMFWLNKPSDDELVVIEFKIEKASFHKADEGINELLSLD